MLRSANYVDSGPVVSTRRGVLKLSILIYRETKPALSVVAKFFDET